MTRTLRVNTQSLTGTASNDCVLDANDPVHALKGPAMLGTLTPESVLVAYDAHKTQQIADQHFALRDQARSQGIRPGTPAWFALTQTRRR